MDLCPHYQDPDQCLICWAEFNVRLERLRVQSGLSRSAFEKVIRECIAKYRRAQRTEGGITMKPEKEAYNLARGMVSDHMTIGDIEWLIRNHSIADPRREKLLAAVYPGYPEVKEALAKALTPEIEDLHLQEINAYAAAAFQLGFAAAMQLRGI
jgi:hypothetical protein